MIKKEKIITHLAEQLGWHEKPEDELIKPTTEDKIKYEMYKEGHLKENTLIYLMENTWSAPSRFEDARKITVEEAKNILDKENDYKIWIDHLNLVAITIDEDNGIEIPIWLMGEFKEYNFIMR